MDRFYIIGILLFFIWKVIAIEIYLYMCVWKYSRELSYWAEILLKF